MGDTFRGGQVPVHSPDIEKTVLINPLPLFSRVHVAPFLLAYPLAYDAFYHAYDTLRKHNLAGSNVNLLKSLPHGLLPPVFPSRRSDMQ
ncbi:putative cation-transporting ATPase 1 [Rhodosporidiobolus nylandii]